MNTQPDHINRTDRFPVRPTVGPAAFTLVELLVVIALIVTLIGIGVVVMQQAMAAGAESETRATLGRLKTAETTYRSAILDGRRLPDNTNMAQLLERLRKHPESDSILQTIGKRLEENRVLDGWDRPIVYVVDPSTSGINPLPTDSFFRSNGPSGNANRTDDNIYSFELN